jgi:hypothetical protein
MAGTVIAAKRFGASRDLYGGAGQANNNEPLKARLEAVIPRRTDARLAFSYRRHDMVRDHRNVRRADYDR